MKDFTFKHDNEHKMSISFNIEADEVMEIGDAMEAINDEAYMNGYNWEAFLKSYLQHNKPDLLEGLDTDSEAGTFVAIYSKSNSEKADKLIYLINNLIDKPSEVYKFLILKGEEIEWD